MHWNNRVQTGKAGQYLTSFKTLSSLLIRWHGTFVNTIFSPQSPLTQFPYIRSAEHSFYNRLHSSGGTFFSDTDVWASFYSDVYIVYVNVFETKEIPGIFERLNAPNRKLCADLHLVHTQVEASDKSNFRLSF